MSSSLPSARAEGEEEDASVEKPGSGMRWDRIARDDEEAPALHPAVNDHETGGSDKEVIDISDDE